MQFPDGFVKKIRKQYWEMRQELFLPLLMMKLFSAFRINPLKEKQLSFSDAIPNTPWGLLWEGFRGNHQNM